MEPFRIYKLTNWKIAALYGKIFKINIFVTIYSHIKTIIFQQKNFKKITDYLSAIFSHFRKTDTKGIYSDKANM